MFGKKKKSIPERVLTSMGSALDGQTMGIVKNVAAFLAGLVAVAVGSSAAVNAIRDEDE